jgi:hypothetical protein
MTSIQFYHSLLIDDDTEIWNEIDNHLFGSDYDLDIDNRIFSGE